MISAEAFALQRTFGRKLSNCALLQLHHYTFSAVISIEFFLKYFYIVVTGFGVSTIFFELMLDPIALQIAMGSLFRNFCYDRIAAGGAGWRQSNACACRYIDQIYDSCMLNQQLCCAHICKHLCTCFINCCYKDYCSS